MKSRFDVHSVYLFDLYGCIKQICVCILPLVSDEFLLFASARDVNVMLEGCSLECCHTFRQLFRVVNSLKKILLAALCVCLALSPMRSMFYDVRKFIATSFGG
jgi:hypothetical protein